MYIKKKRTRTEQLRDFLPRFQYFFKHCRHNINTPPVKVNGESIQMHVYKNKKKLIGAFFGEETSSLQQLIDTVPKS